MGYKPVFCAGVTPAMLHTKRYLSHLGIPVAEKPDWSVGHILLDVPSFRPGSPLAEQGNLDTLLSSLPKNTTVWGGQLNHPSLDPYKTMDLLKDEQYLSDNAAITADCTLQVAASRLDTVWKDTPALIIGWGRIGKCLGFQLTALGCPVTIAARNPAHRATLHSLGYHSLDFGVIKVHLPQYRLIINTVPSPVLSQQDTESLTECVKIDLASSAGIQGSDVFWARGLPGILAPESSGKLIAETFLRLVREE